MKNKIIILLLLIFTTNLFSMSKKDPYRHQYPLITKQMYKDGLLCKERIFKCLPEYNNISLWNIEIPYSEDEYDLYEGTKEYAKIVQDNNNKRNNKVLKKQEKTKMNEDDINRKFRVELSRKKFLIYMEKQLEKEFPGFWRDVPKKVRYRWINIARLKADKYNYNTRNNNMMVELCARIGLYFDKDKKYSDIVKFIKYNKHNVALACDYLDFTLFDKLYDYGGSRITTWSLQGAFPHLPYPDKPIPKLKSRH